MPRIRELAIMSLRLLKFASNEASSDDPAAGNSGWAIIPPSPPTFPNWLAKSAPKTVFTGTCGHSHLASAQ
ncbi:hypothetical protein BDFG_08089 [Blastomyces dermatitidis ATCC 26199]|nr:hypothetical protein BDFG_08089 [Blastomyces dermatitidis ATCC 26199]